MTATFDAIAARVADATLSFTEAEALRTHWEAGEDAWLREDPRFRPTPWGRWVLAERWLVNDELVRSLRCDGASELSLAEQLATLATVLGRPTAICDGDPRLLLDGDRLRLAPSEQGQDPLVENVDKTAQFETHLPLLTLKAAAASEPAGEWGPSAEPQEVTVKGWVRVADTVRPLNRRMFIAGVKGHSMDGGGKPIEDGDHVIFEYSFHKGTAYESGASRPTVLVRGEFHDPETGTYAVKRWEEGESALHLVSNNPDKERFPDIVVPIDDADHIRVVASLAHVLKPGEFARSPKPRPVPGRRVLGGKAALQALTRRLDQRLEAFFEGKPSTDDDGLEPEATGWTTRVVCLAPESGGLCLELGPLEALPPFVKKLEAEGTGWKAILSASNARVRAERTPVRADSGPWRWSAVGFADEEELGMERLDAEALPTDTATVFRLDASEVGRRQYGRSLSPGLRYRVVLPPGLGDVSWGHDLGAGWRLWTVDLGGEPNATTVTALTAVGLGVGEAAPKIEWSLFPPTAWNRSPRGEGYAVFAVGQTPVAQVEGLPQDDEPAWVVLRGPTITERTELPADGRVTLSLGTLGVGRWACEVLHPRTAIQPARLMFEVVPAVKPRPVVAWTLRVADQEITDGAQLHANLAEQLTPFELDAPPGWPVVVRWRGLADRVLATAHADAAGKVDISGAAPGLAERARRARVADVWVDLGELGHATVQHARRPAAADLEVELRRLWSERDGLVRTRAGQWLTLVPAWFAPVTELLGYGMIPLLVAERQEERGDLTFWRLYTDERGVTGVNREAVRLLALTSEVARVSLDQVDQACRDAGVWDAIITDGVIWVAHRRGSRLGARVWDLGAALTDGTLRAMLADFAEGAG